MIPYGRQSISKEDIQSVVDVLKSDFLTQGPIVPQFENAISNYCDVKYAVATNSATSSLHLACLALQVGIGDIVWTSAITFVASANCAIYCGASVDFVDIDPKTYNMSIESLKSKLEKAEKNGTLPKVVIAVHFSGQSCDMKSIHSLGKKFGFKIIEDASHAIGGKYFGEPIGNCRYSEITVFSFHPVKIITTGEGGMSVTNNRSLYAIMQRLRSHGITRDSSEMTNLPEGSWYYQQIQLGFNYRLTDIQAALGLSQFSRLDEFVNTRNEIAKKYDKLLQNSDFKLPFQDLNNYSSCHLYVIRVNNGNICRKELFERLRVNGILVNVHYIPVYHHPFYKVFGYSKKDFPEAEKYYAEAISLPIYFGLKDEDIDFVVNKLNSPLNFQTIF